MSDKDKYYIDGYGTKRPKDVPFWDSAKGQVDLVASISNDILPTSYSFINRAHPYKLSEDVLKNIPMYNWESVANRIRNSFGISGGLGATGTYIYLRNEKGSR